MNATAFFASLGLVVVMDFLWLGFVMKDFNLRQLAQIGRIEDGNFQVMMAPAAGAYLLMALSLTLFALPKATSATAAVAWGAALGLVIYGIYDFTNLAILRSYPLPFAAADIAWGTFLYALATWLLGWQLGLGRAI